MPRTDRRATAPCGCFYVDYAGMDHVGVVLCREHTDGVLPGFHDPDHLAEFLAAALDASPSGPGDA